MFPPGTQIRGYTVERALDAAAGWHELVARDAQGREVVLRIPPDVEGAERVRSEAALAKKHKNDNLLPSLELIEHNGWPIQVLAWVDGLPLEALCVQAGALPPAAVCRIGRQIGLALVELHERAGMAHGALAADRILIDTGGNARLMDLGCARPTSPVRLQSAERRRSHGAPSTMDDLWSLGVILADAALGGAADPTLPDSPPVVGTGKLPERLDDALKVLIAPLGARITNAAAAVRVFTDVEKGLGDGTHALRKALYEARNPRTGVRGDTVVGGASTIPDTGKPFEGLMRDAGENPDEHPATQENTHPSNPRTMELTPDRVLDVVQMIRMSEIAEEAARRTDTPHPLTTPPGAVPAVPPLASLPARAEKVADFPQLDVPTPVRARPRPKPAQASAPVAELPLHAPRDIHDEITMSDHRASSVVVAGSAPQRVPTLVPFKAEDPNTLDDAERAALGMPLLTKLVIAAVVGAVIVVVLLLLRR